MQMLSPICNGMPSKWWECFNRGFSSVLLLYLPMWHLFFLFFLLGCTHKTEIQLQHMHCICMYIIIKKMPKKIWEIIFRISRSIVCPSISCTTIRIPQNINVDVECNGSYLGGVLLYRSQLLTSSSMSSTFSVRDSHPHLDWSHFIGNMQLNALQIPYNKSKQKNCATQIKWQANSQPNTRFIYI